MRLRLTLVKSPIGYESSQRRTVEALGLRRIGSQVVQEDTPQLQGMLRKIRHLLAVREEA